MLLFDSGSWVDHVWIGSQTDGVHYKQKQEYEVEMSLCLLNKD